MSDLVLAHNLLHGWNASKRSRVGVGMNRSARGGSVKRFERSNGLDTVLYKNYLFLHNGMRTVDIFFYKGSVTIFDIYKAYTAYATGRGL